MKERTKKMLLIITLVLAGFTILAKTILNSDYYNIVKAINKNYDIQNPIDYQDEETNNTDNSESAEQNDTQQDATNEQENSNIQVEENTDNQTNIENEQTDNTDENTGSDEQQNNNTEETTMPSRPTVEM